MGRERITRRRFLGALGGSAAWVAAPAQAGSADLPLRAGVGTADITPPLEVGLLMSSSARRWAPFERVRLPLMARAVVLETAPERPVALVALDLLGLAGEAVGGWKRFKDRVASYAGNDFRPSDIVLASTHTHTGPESIALTDLYQTDAFAAWVKELSAAIGSAIARAAKASQPCRLVAGSVSARGLAVNRRIRTTRGVASVRRKLPPEIVIGPEGPVDERLTVFGLMDSGGRLEALLVHFTAHPVLEMCIPHVSPDYPGELCLELQRRHPGCTAIFLQGPCGNINPPTMQRSPENARRYAVRLAELADRALQQSRPLGGERLWLRWATIQLPARDLTGRSRPSPLEISLAALTVGQAAWVFLPGEPFVEIGLAIRRKSPWPLTTVVGYAENYIGYIPTDRAFENGGYEIGPGRWSRVDRGSEKMVVGEAVRLLEALHQAAPAGPP